MVHFSRLVHHTGVEQARNSQLVSDAMWAIQGNCGACLGSGPSGGSLHQCYSLCQNCAQSEGWLLLYPLLFSNFPCQIRVRHLETFGERESCVPRIHQTLKP